CRTSLSSLCPYSGARRHLHSSPTRRSSDLWTAPNKKPGRSAPALNVVCGGSEGSGDDAQTGPHQADRIHVGLLAGALLRAFARRSEEHTSELQSREKLVCRLLLEKKKKMQS